MDVRNHHIGHPNLMLRQLVWYGKIYGKTYTNPRRPGDLDTSGRASPLAGGGKAHMVESPSESHSAFGNSEIGEVLAVSFSSAPSGETLVPWLRTTTPSAPAMPKYALVSPRKEAIKKSNEACYVCLSTARPCDCVKYMPDDIC